MAVIIVEPNITEEEKKKNWNKLEETIKNIVLRDWNYWVEACDKREEE